MAIVTVQQLSSKIFSLQHSRNEHLPYDSTVDKCPEQVQIEEVNLQAQNFSQVAKNEQEVALPMSRELTSQVEQSDSHNYGLCFKCVRKHINRYLGDNLLDQLSCSL